MKNVSGRLATAASGGQTLVVGAALKCRRWSPCLSSALTDHWIKWTDRWRGAVSERVATDVWTDSPQVCPHFDQLLTQELSLGTAAAGNPDPTTRYPFKNIGFQNRSARGIYSEWEMRRFFRPCRNNERVWVSWMTSYWLTEDLLPLYFTTPNRYSTSFLLG